MFAYPQMRGMRQVDEDYFEMNMYIQIKDKGEVFV